MTTGRSVLYKTCAVAAFMGGALVACTTDMSGTTDSDDISDRAPSSSGGEGTSGGTSSSGGVETTKTGLPCDVDKVLKTRCQTCHSAETKYGASAPLVTYADLTKTWSTGKKVYAMVKDRIHDAARPMPPQPNPVLDASEMGILDKWIDGGAKASSDVCTSEKANDGVKPLSCKTDTTLRPSAKFNLAPGGEIDQYVCYGVDINLAKKRHVTGFAPHVDNKKIVHHILLFQAPQAESPTPKPCSAFGSASWKLVAGWAPGGNNLEPPVEAGYPEEKGTTHWVLQVHYNNALNKTGEIDASGYDMCTTETLRPNDAGTIAFGSTRFTIPARSTTKLRCDYRLPNTFQNVKFFNASPHMHTRGVAMSTERIPNGNGTPEKVFDMPAFNFENQANYPIKSAVQPNDVIRTRCAWKNAGDTNIGFGEGTGDEMCFDFIGYYPNIPDRTLLGLPIFTWITPSQSATCTTE